MNRTQTPDSPQNPYHPYKEAGRYRAFRNGWVAQREQEPRSANPHSFTQTGRALAWLDGWTAAAGAIDETKRRKRRAVHWERGLTRVLDELGGRASDLC